MRQMADFCREAIREDRAGRKKGPSLSWLECPASHSQRCGGISLFPQNPQGFYFVFYIPFSITLQFDNNRSLMEYTQ